MPQTKEETIDDYDENEKLDLYFDQGERCSLQNSDGYHLFCKYWLKDVTNFRPKALVFIAHGYAEHCLRYTQLAHSLIQNEIYPFAHDHVGHGQSEGTEVTIDNFDIYIRDVIQHIKMVKDKFPGVPVCAIGHSMGGCIVLSTCLKEPDLISKMVLIGPAVVPIKQLDNFCLRPMLKLLGFFFPDLKLPYKVDEELLTLNEQQTALIANDPLIYHGAIKAGFLKAFLEALKELGGNLHRIHCPLLILHGERDIIVPPENSEILHEKASSKHKTLKIYPELQHQLHCEKEPEGDAIRQEISQWLLTTID